MRFLTPADLRGLDSRALEDLRGRTEAVVAAGSGELSGLAAAALMFADYAVVAEGSTLVLDPEPMAWAAAKGRLGRRAFRLLLEGRDRFDAREALELGLCDGLLDDEPERWFDRWMQDRSPLALDTAAVLIRSRGGDALERAAFAHLFAIGEPQKGLAAFLEKRRPAF
jgi:enoyl-CoA hydratase/carnithine racemase